MTVVVVLASDGAVWDVEVSPADPDPDRHALVMLRGMLIRRGSLPELRVVGRRDNDGDVRCPRYDALVVDRDHDDESDDDDRCSLCDGTGWLPKPSTP